MDERLRFEAYVRDNATGALKKIRAELSAVKVTPGMTAATKWLGEFTKGGEEFLTAARGFAGPINAMGLAGLASAAGLAELVKQMKEMSDRQLAMREVGREVGMTTDQVNAFTRAGANFGVSGEAMGNALNHLAGQMPEFRRNLGPLMHELGRWPNLIQKLQREGTADQLKDIFAFLNSPELKKEPQLQKKLAEAFFGNGEEIEKLFGKASDGAKNFLEEWQRMQKAIDPISPKLLEAEDKFRASMTELNTALSNFENQVGPAFLNSLTAIVNGAKSFFDSVPKAIEQMKEEVSKATESRGRFRGSKAPPSLIPDIPMPRGRNQGIFKRSDYEEDDGQERRRLFHNAAYTDEASAATGSAAFGLGKMIAEGTKAGVLAAFREMMAEREAEAGAAGARFSAASLGGGGEGGVYGGSGGHRYGGGGRVSSKGFTGGTGKWWNSEHVTHAVDRLMKEAGLSREGAEGLVARWAGVEAAGGPTSRNPASGALGIGQWLGDRQRGFGPDFDSQISHAIDELNHSEKRAGNVLRQAKTAAEAARGASMFERAEGYNPRTGYDNFSGKSLAASRRVHQLYGGVGADHARSGPVASPRDPGSIGWNPWLYPNNGNNIVVDPFGNPRRAKGTPGEDTEKGRDKPFAGTIRADLHIHGNTSKAIVRSTGPIEARLRRWPTMTEASDLA